MSDAYTKITLDVIKRNGKKVSFDASKIALAIKKALIMLLYLMIQMKKRKFIQKKMLTRFI